MERAVRRSPCLRQHSPNSRAACFGKYGTDRAAASHASRTCCRCVPAGAGLYSCPSAAGDASGASRTGSGCPAGFWSIARRSHAGRSELVRHATVWRAYVSRPAIVWATVWCAYVSRPASFWPSAWHVGRIQSAWHARWVCATRNGRPGLAGSASRRVCSGV